MKFLNFGICLSFLFVEGSRNLNVELIKFGLNYYQQSRSVVFLHANVTMSYLSEVKNLINEGYFFSPMTLMNFENSIEKNRQGGKATVAVFEYGKSFIEILERLTLTGRISCCKWLLTTPKFNLEDFKGVEIPLNVELIVAETHPLDGFNIIEVYETKPGMKWYNVLGRWTEGRRNLEISTDFFPRRKNLNGVAIKVVSPSKDPCSGRSFVEGIASIVHCIHKRIWDVLTEMVNATTEIIVEPNLTLNTLHDTGAELTFRSFPLNSFDLETRSYLWPVFDTKTHIVTSYIEQKVQWRTYILPFSKEMWIGILIWIVLYDLALFFGEFLTRKGTYGDAILAYWSRYSFSSFFAFCDQSVTDAPKLISYRIIFLGMFLVPCVLIPGYSAIVTSYLTVPLRKMPFRNLEELSQTKDYGLGWHRTFPVEYLFNMNDSSPMKQALFKNNVLPQSKLPVTDAEGVERMCTEKFAFLTTMDTILALKPRCNYFKLKEYFRIIFTTMEMKKKSWYEEFLNRCERSVDFTGVLYRIALDAVRKYIKYNENLALDADEAKPIKMENIVLPFVVLFLGVVCSVVLLRLEIVYFQRTGKNRRGKNTRRGNVFA